MDCSGQGSILAERLEILKLPKELLKNDDLRYGSVSKLSMSVSLAERDGVPSYFQIECGYVRGYEKAVAALSRKLPDARRTSLKVMR